MLLKASITRVQEELFEVVLYFTEGPLMRTERFTGHLEACKQWIKQTTQGE